MTTTFYRAPCARVTSRVFEAWCPTQRRFDIRDLTQVQTREEDLSLSALVAGRRVCSGGLAGIAITASATGWSPAIPWLVCAAALLVVLRMALPALRVWCGRTQVYELTAIYHGRLVTLYRSTDPLVFKQVKRALFRALEARAQQARDT